MSFSSSPPSPRKSQGQDALQQPSSPMSVSPASRAQPTPQSNERRSLSEIIGQPFPPFDHQSDVARPFESLAETDVEFQNKLCEMLLSLMIKFNAWSTVRIKNETEVSARTFESKISKILDAEKEQEITRQRLNEFVNCIKAALAALTGLRRG